MDFLNYHHLQYFWTVAREGSIVQACKLLHVTQSTISAQIRRLEKAAGANLFDRVGRNLVLTETGHVVYRYANEIFSLGRELMETLDGRPGGHALRLRVGSVLSMPKTIVYRLLEPAMQIEEPVQIIYDEGSSDELLARLAVHSLDVVLSDVPSSPHVRVNAFNHLLGECGVSIMCSARSASKYRRNFPRSLHGAPFLVPGAKSALRQELEQWFDREEIRPVIRGELADSTVLKVFGSIGVGIFAIPSVVEEEVQRQYRVRSIGRLPAIRERFYAISTERRLRHPAVVAITDAARQRLFISD